MAIKNYTTWRRLKGMDIRMRENVKAVPKKVPLIAWISPLLFVGIALISLYLTMFVVRYEVVDTILFHTYNIVYKSNGKEVGTLIEVLVSPVPWGGLFLYLPLAVLFGMPILVHYQKNREEQK